METNLFTIIDVHNIFSCLFTLFYLEIDVWTSIVKYFSTKCHTENFIPAF